MLGNNTSKRRILNITVAILAIALVYSLAGTVFASDSDAPHPSIFNLDVEIPGSENIPNVSIGEFRETRLKIPGVNAIVNGSEEVPDLIDPQSQQRFPAGSAWS